MINERERLRLYEQLGQTIGPEHAGTLMELLPPTSWDDIATNERLEAQGAQLRSEMAELRGDLRSEMAELRSDLHSEMADLRAELRGEATELRGDLHSEMADLRAELRGEATELRGDLHSEMAELRSGMNLDMARHMRVQVGANMATMLTLAALIVGLG